MCVLYMCVCVCVCMCVYVCMYGASQVRLMLKNLSALQESLILRLGRFPGVGNDNPLQYSGLKNSMDRGAWQATVHGVAKSWTRRKD